MNRLGIGLLLVCGCFYPADRGKALEVKVDRLTSQNDALTAQVRDQQERLVNKIDGKIEEVQKALDGLDKAARRTDADIGVQMQKSMEDLAQLRGQVETYLHKIGELENEVKRITDDADKKLVAAQGEDAVKAADARKKGQDLKRPDDKKQFLALATEKANADEVALARQLYVEFLKKWPKDELTGDAHFGLGETFYKEERCREALGEYGQVIQRFAGSKSAPEAYLRSAECFKRLKMLDESRLALEELVKQHPKSSAAKQAKGKIQELDKEKKKTAAAGKKGAK